MFLKVSFQTFLIISLVFLPNILAQSTTTTTTGNQNITTIPSNSTIVVVPTDNTTVVVLPNNTNTTAVAPSNPTNTTVVVTNNTDNGSATASPVGPIYATPAGARIISTDNARIPSIIDIDLAQNYTTQWSLIATTYQTQLNNFFAQVNASTIAAALSLPAGANIVLAALAGIDFPSLAIYNQDIANQLQAFSNLTNISIANLAILNFVYDYATATTSVVAQDTANNVFHGFSFDSPLADLIAPLTLHARYYNNGTFLFEGFTLAGYLGLLAGYKAGVYSASVNRLAPPPTYWQQLANFNDDLTHFLLLDLTASQTLRQGFISTTSFDDLIQYLSSAMTVTDTFYTVAGTSASQGAVLAKARDTLENRTSLSDVGSEWYLVQSNYLRNGTDPTSDNRATAASNELNVLTQGNITALTLAAGVLDLFPVFNNNTVWNVVMQPNANFTNLTVWW